LFTKLAATIGSHNFLVGGCGKNEHRELFVGRAVKPSDMARSITQLNAGFGRIGTYVPTEAEKAILVKHLRTYSEYEPGTPQRDDEVNLTQQELAPIDIYDWQRKEIRYWFDNNRTRELKLTVPQLKVPSITTYQRDIDEPAKLRFSTTRKKK
jgi:hypothetical protein